MFNPLSPSRPQPKLRSFAVPSSIRGVQFGPESISACEGLSIKETEDGWMITVSVLDILSSPDGAQSAREVWPSTTLMALVDRHLNTVDKDVARLPFHAAECVDFNRAAKYLKLGRVSIYNENAEVASQMNALHRFAFGLYNARLCSPKLTYDAAKKRHQYRQDYSHRLTDIRQFTPDMMYRELIRWANGLMEEIMTEWGVPYRAFNCAGRLETPLGRLPAAKYRVEHIQQDINIAHDVILQARRHLDIEDTGAQETDLRMVYMPAVAGWDARGYLPMGMESYARFCGMNDQVDIKQNNLCLSIAMLMGRQLLRWSGAMDFIEGIEIDQMVSLDDIRALHNRFMDSLVLPTTIAVQKPVIIPIQRPAASPQAQAQENVSEIQQKIEAARQAKDARRKFLSRPERTRKPMVGEGFTSSPRVNLSDTMPERVRADAPVSDLTAAVPTGAVNYMYQISPAAKQQTAVEPAHNASANNAENIPSDSVIGGYGFTPKPFAEIVEQAKSRISIAGDDDYVYGNAQTVSEIAAQKPQQEAANATAPKLLKAISVSELRENAALRLENDMARAEAEGFGIYSLIRDESAKFKGRAVEGKGTFVDGNVVKFAQYQTPLKYTGGRMLTATDVYELLNNKAGAARLVMESMAQEAMSAKSLSYKPSATTQPVVPANLGTNRDPAAAFYEALPAFLRSGPSK